MPYDPQKHHRHSIRLKEYDYTQAGAYFVTICTQKHVLLFDPLPVREMIQRWWEKLPEKFYNVETDVFVIMPNHIHGIVVLVGVDPRVDPVMGRTHGSAPTDPRVDLVVGRTHGSAPTDPRTDPVVGRTHGSAPTSNVVSLAEVVQWFKTMTTNEYIRGVKHMGWTPFTGKLWQRNYYEHIIRNEVDFNQSRAYILDNPHRWLEDELRPPAQAGG